VRTIHVLDSARNRRYPCEVWYPATARHRGQDLTPATQDMFTLPAGGAPRSQMAVRDTGAQEGTFPLIVFSHSSGRWQRRGATFLCTHLGSHGYVVAAMDHSEVVAPELARREGESSEEKTARVRAVIGSRVPDVRFLLDHLLGGAGWGSEAMLDPGRVGIVGHSFGGWTALAAAEVEPRIGAAVALAPGGVSRPKPGILPATLTFNCGRDVPTLYLAGDNDVMIPLDGVCELFARTPARKSMVVLRRADHLHFMDHVEEEHEMARTMPWPAELAWIPQEMRPMAELVSGEQAHRFARGLTVCHLDAVLREDEDARRFLDGDIEAALATLGIAAVVHRA
jgi:dienelactone hydrolase